MRVYVLGGLAIVALLIGGCGGGGSETASTGRAEASNVAQTSETPSPYKCLSPGEQLQVTLDGHEGAENAGFLIADERGYFRDAGLDVWVRTPGSPELPLSYVAIGDDDIGIVQQPQIVLGREIEETVVAIGSVISEPTAAMIWLKGSGIGDVSDLAGKKIAIAGALYQSKLLEQVLAQADLTLEDVEVAAVGYELVPALLNGEVDAIFGGSANLEGAALEARGAEPVITPVQKLGVPAYDELMVVARPECAAQHPALYRRFMTALARGTRAAVNDPRAVVKAIDGSLERDPEAGHGETEAQVKATLPLLSRSGHIDLGQAADFVDWMQAQGMIEAAPPVSKMFTNDYLAP